MSGKNPLGSGREPQAYEGLNIITPLAGWQLVVSSRAPTTNDKKYPLGTIWINKTTSTSYQLVTKPGIWTILGAAAGGDIQTLTGDSGGALLPSTGNMNLLGTANQITTTGSGSTITWSLPSALTAPGSVTATTTLTATLGAITATNGNLVLGTAGNKIMSTSVASTTTAGANSFGKVTLVGGTATVSTTAVTANSIIILTRQSVGATGAAALGELSIGTITASTSFVINAWSQANATSLAATDVSSIGWMIIN